MGGLNGEVRGRTKIEAYLEYQKIAENDLFTTKIPDPKNKKECKRIMVWDPDAEEWVLHYHMHT